MADTDQELLELAAKAAGLHIDKSEINGGGRGNTGFTLFGDANLDCYNNVTWNPLRRDGDAFWLAVKLGIHITNSMTSAWASHICATAIEPLKGDACAATRRAITRCAAEIGRNMQEQPHGR